MQFEIETITVAVLGWLMLQDLELVHKQTHQRAEMLGTLARISMAVCACSGW